MHALDHAVLLVDAVLDLLQIGRHLSERLFLQPIGGLLQFPGTRQNILDCVGDNKIFPRSQPHDRLIRTSGNRLLFVHAVVGEISDWGQAVAAHGSCVLFCEMFRRWFSIVLEVAQGRAVSVLGVRLQALPPLSGKVGDLDNVRGTPGLEVVRWQKVEPVGGIS